LAKHNIDVKILIDTREKNIDYLKTIKIDSRRNSDGIKVIEIERCTVKPTNECASIGDISFSYKIEGDSEWTQAKFAIERKAGLDLFSSLYTKANKTRLESEMKRAYDNNIDMYFIVTDDISLLKSKIIKVRKFDDKSCIIFFDNLLKFNELLMKYNIPFITSGEDLGWLVRRLVKKYIQKYKLNYR